MSPPVVLRPAEPSRRARAVLIDALTLGTCLFAAACLAVILEAAATVWIAAACAGAALLYESIMIALTGGTLGHRSAYIWVVDRRSGSTPTFGQAVVRTAAKLILGPLSAAGMLLLRWDAPLHDHLAGTVVCLRDAAQPDPVQFTDHRPRLWRRAATAAVYLAALGSFTLWVIGELGSADCMDGNGCSAEDVWLRAVVGVGALALAGWTIALARRGRLPGAD